MNWAPLRDPGTRTIGHVLRHQAEAVGDDIFLMDANGANQTLVTTTAGSIDSTPALSPDNSTIAYTSRTIAFTGSGPPTTGPARV